MPDSSDNVYYRRFLSLQERLGSLYKINENGCWIYQGSKTIYGYGQFWWNGKNRRAHRVSFELAYGEIPEGALVLHKCHDRACINPEHLSLGDHLENMQDRDEANRTLKGSQHGMSKLSEADVAVIVCLFLTGEASKTDVAITFGVTRGCVSAILCGRLWSHFTGITSNEDLVNRRDFFLSRFCPPSRSPGPRSEGIPGTPAVWEDFDDWKGTPE